MRLIEIDRWRSIKSSEADFGRVEYSPQLLLLPVVELDHELAAAGADLAYWVSLKIRADRSGAEREIERRLRPDVNLVNLGHKAEPGIDASPQVVAPMLDPFGILEGWLVRFPQLSNEIDACEVSRRGVHNVILINAGAAKLAAEDILYRSQGFHMAHCTIEEESDDAVRFIHN